MLWEQSRDPLVNLCNAFRKAVVRELQSQPDAAQKILGAFSADELAMFDAWSKNALARSHALQAELTSAGADTARITGELDRIVLEMSEKSAAYALAVLGQDKLRTFVDPAAQTSEISLAYSQRNYPHLARIFAPR